MKKLKSYESFFIKGMNELAQTDLEKAFKLTIERLALVEDRIAIQKQVLVKLLKKQSLKYSDLIVDKDKTRQGIPFGMSKKVFFKSQIWKKLRYKILSERKNICNICKIKGENVSWHIDHIRPISIYPELALDENNLQILCDKCNLGKYDIVPKKIILRKNGIPGAG